MKLRKWEKNDLDELLALANNKRVADFLGDSFPHPYGRHTGKEFLEIVGNTPEEDAYIRGITVDGKLVGCITLKLFIDIFRLNGEVGYWIGEPYWGNGYATEALKEIVDIAFNQYQLKRVYAEVFINNPGSMRVLEKAGFTKEGCLRNRVVKNEIILDTFLYSILPKEDR